MNSLAKSGESLDAIVRRVRERARREKLHRRIGAIERKLDKIGNPSTGLKRDRAWRLTSMLKRLRLELAQPELFL